MSAINVAVIGLDTSHSVEFGRRMNARECPRNQRVAGLHAVACMRFETPFQDREGLDARQEQLERWGIKVTEDFSEAVSACDAIMLEINDPSRHLEYFERVAALGKPVFLDKPLAGSVEDGRAIVELAAKHGTRVWSGSSIPFVPAIARALASVPEVTIGHAFGALGQAPAGDSLVWYGVHSFEMLQRIMGHGAETVMALESQAGVVAVVSYAGHRQGIVESIRGMGSYGGRVQCKERTVTFVCNTGYAYRDLLRKVKDFFRGGPAPVNMQTTFEGLAMMAAARRSIDRGGATVEVEKLGM